jgi:hypothetical protein
MTSDPRPHVDTRTRAAGSVETVDPAAFWSGAWRDARDRNGRRATQDAARLGLPPVVLAIDGEEWTLGLGDDGLDVTRGAHAARRVAMDAAAFADLVAEERTALGLVIGARVDGDPDASWTFCGWDPVLRSMLDGRAVYAPGDVELLGPDGGPLELGQSFRLGEHADAAGRFLAETGFVLLTDVFSDAEMDAVDADLAAAVACAEPDDGTSWWATTASGDRYPCRILDFARRSPALRALIDEERFLAIGELLGDGHIPGDPFGEHNASVTAEGLTKRVGSVEGLACLPWHKDCDRGGHARYCSGLTVGICLTPVDDAHGGLDVVAGSHRANIARAQVDAGLDLPSVTLRAGRGDVTVHLSCTLHRSTQPTSAERRVAYTGFTLPPPDGDARGAGADPARLARDRAAIGAPERGARLGAGRQPG